jgi:predicted DNA-binding transcriptional regulator AlpA
MFHMPAQPQAPQDRLLPTRLLCERYSVVDKTIDRWVDRGILPKPMRINGMRYWRESELERRVPMRTRTTPAWPWPL